MPIVPFLKSLIVWVLASVVTRILAALGFGFMTHKGLKFFMVKFMDTLALYLSKLPELILIFFRLAEIDTAISIIFSAILTKVVMNSAMVFLGVKS